MPTVKRFLDVETKLDDLQQKFIRFEKYVGDRFDNLAKIISNIAAPASISSGATQRDLIVAVAQDVIQAEEKKSTAVLLNYESANDDNILRDVKSLAGDADFDESKIVGARRSGPVKTLANGKVLPRIVKVDCDSPAAKIAFIKAINTYTRVNPTAQGANNLRARPDLTFAQREQGRNLRKEKMDRETNGEVDLFIDYQRGIVIKNRNKHIIRA
jgi:hypothetical protein